MDFYRNVELPAFPTKEHRETVRRILRDNGINVLEIPSAELSRGRGGPRCMSMPLNRAAL